MFLRGHHADRHHVVVDTVNQAVARLPQLELARSQARLASSRSSGCCINHSKDGAGTRQALGRLWLTE